MFSREWLGDAAPGMLLILAIGIFFTVGYCGLWHRLQIEVDGTVTKLEWKSPHGRLYVDVKNEKGEVESWNFELPSPNTLMRRGWTRDTLKTGDRVKVAGAPARNFPTIAIATSIKDANDKPLFTGTTQIYEPEAEPKGAE